MKKIKKIVASVILATMLIFGTGSQVHAGYWGENFGANIMQVMIEEAWAILEATILKSLKQSAIKTIKEQVEKAVSGTTGANQIIADYEGFIYYSTIEESSEYLTDFFSVLQSGVSPGEREMLRDVEISLANRLVPMEPSANLHEVVSTQDPIGDMFSQQDGGGVKALMSYTFGDYNNPYNAYYNSRDITAQKSLQLEESAKTEAIAGQGFKTMSDGNKAMPGSVFQSLVAQAEGAPIDMISGASDWREVVASFASSLIGSAIKNGINTVADPAISDLRRISRKIDRGYANIQNSIYRGN